MIEQCSVLTTSHRKKGKQFYTITLVTRPCYAQIAVRAQMNAIVQINEYY